MTSRPVEQAEGPALGLAAPSSLAGAVAGTGRVDHSGHRDRADGQRNGQTGINGHDLHVDRELSMATAHTIRGLRPWVTNEYEHDGLALDNGAVLDRLIAKARGTA